MTNLKINDEKKDELLEKQKCITKAIGKYNKRKNNNQLSKTYSDQPESSGRNISSKIEKESNLSDDNLQFINSIKKILNIRFINQKVQKRTIIKNKRRFN
ncbi:hypothetical protein [Candidatus Phytoplasma rubi]|uniref:hypothetical protein n=1 Tax=Candidatus Phytoplasma rubi TaxID=399025 RepID=UPI00228567D6|nr:hypothetical protein [Candidatus Phytoplasma rubi]